MKTKKQELLKKEIKKLDNFLAYLDKVAQEDEKEENGKRTRTIFNKD